VKIESSGVTSIPQSSDSGERTSPRSPFYQRSYGTLGAGLLVGSLIGVLPGLFIIIDWSSDRQVPTNIGVMILIAYLVTMAISMVGSVIVFGWIDYWLSRAGLGKPIRSAIWIGIAAAIMLCAPVYVARMNIVLGIVTVLGGSIIAAGIAWFINTQQLKRGTNLAHPQSTDLELQKLRSFIQKGDGAAIKGLYRFTANEFLWSSGYSNMAKSKFWMEPRVISVLLPRSLDHGEVDKGFSSHEYQNKINYFTISEKGITCGVEDTKKQTANWSDLDKVIKTPKGFLVYWKPKVFDWIPNHAFFSRRDTDQFTRLAKKSTQYSEIL